MVMGMMKAIRHMLRKTGFALALVWMTANPGMAATPPEDVFARLAASTDPAEAEALAAILNAAFTEHESPTVRLLMERAAALTADQARDEAEAVYAGAIAADPEFAQAWYLRAGLRAARGDVQGAANDLRRALDAEPRHVFALAALGEVLEDDVDPRPALAAFEAALRLYPLMPGIAARAAALRAKVKDSPI